MSRDKVERCIKQLLAKQLIEACDNSKREAKLEIERCPMTSKSTRKRGPSFNDWADEDLLRLAEALQKVRRSRHVPLTKREAITKIVDVCCNYPNWNPRFGKDAEAVERRLYGKKLPSAAKFTEGPSGRPAAKRSAHRPPELLLVDALVDYSRMRPDIEVMARAFEALDQKREPLCRKRPDLERLLPKNISTKKATSPNL